MGELVLFNAPPAIRSGASQGPKASSSEALGLGTNAFRQGAVVAVSVTDFAPIGPRLWKTYTMFGPPLDEAVRTILDRLHRHPDDVSAFRQKCGDIAILAAREDEPRVPLAFIWEGLTAEDFNAALVRLGGRAKGDAAQVVKGARA